MSITKVFTPSHKTKGKRLSSILISTFFGLLLLLMTFTFAPTEAQAYSCGSGSSGHCYATPFWSGTTGGVYSGIKVTALTCNNCNGFINHEIWLIQNSNTGCLYNSCWVEAGYKNETSFGFVYFWDDNRPGGGYNRHLFPSNQSGANPSVDVGYVVNFQIQKTVSNTTIFAV